MTREQYILDLEMMIAATRTHLNSQIDSGEIYNAGQTVTHLIILMRELEDLTKEK